MREGRNGGKLQSGGTNGAGGRPKGVQNSKTRLLRFLSLQMKGKNPVTKEQEEFSVLEMGDLKQIEKMLAGDLSAYREILDRLEGKSQQNQNVNLDGKVEVVWREKLTEEETDVPNEETDNSP